MRIWGCDFMRTWFYGVAKMWVCAEMGLFGCLFVCQCVGMSAYSWPTAPSFHKPLRPPSLGGRAGKGVTVLFVLLPFCPNVFDFTSQLHNHSRLF